MEMKLWEGVLHFFCVPKEIYDWCLHLSVLLNDMGILVQRMNIFVKEEAASMHFCKEREEIERRYLHIAVQSVLCGLDVLIHCFWKGLKQGISKGGYKVCNSSHSSAGRSRWGHRE